MAFNQDQEMQKWSEPVSPNGTLKLEFNDDWGLFNNTSLEFFNDAEYMQYDDDVDNTEIVTETSEEIDEYIKEEPFSDWLERKIHIPIFDGLDFASDDDCRNSETSCHSGALKPQQTQQPQQQDNTQSLLEEFETVLEDVEACHQVVPLTPQQQMTNFSSNLEITPPESPQQNIDTQLLITLQPLNLETVQQSPLFLSNKIEVSYNTIAPVEEPLYVNNASRQWDIVENISLGSLNKDVANDLAEVDEYVRSHTNDTPQPSSPFNSSDSSCISVEDTTNDPDWNVGNEKKKSQPSTSKNQSKIYQQHFRPSIEDKKVRKKEQNKNAATRYRQKKKQEIKVIEDEERKLTRTNENLKNQKIEIKREIKCLKGLLRELFRARGIIP